jgi:GR25 family glycosyltransferase involved in LPS biosynthesis
MIKIFVIHYDKLFERKNHMLKQLSVRNLDAEFISNYGKDKLTLDNKKKFTRLSDSEISVFLHHIECYKKIVECNYDYALILEDDAILVDKFYIKLQKYIHDMPNDWSMLYLGEGNFTFPKKVFNKFKRLVNIFRKPDYAFKYMDGYIIKNTTCNKFIQQFNNANEPINMAIDHYLHNFINTNSLKTFIGEPQLTYQGSINKQFSSHIWHTPINETDDINNLNPNFKLI